MKFTRVTAHFESRELALKAVAKLNKKCPEHFEEALSKGKKASFENNTTGLTGLSKKETRLLMEEAAANIQHHLNDCKGLHYSTLVTR